jgi:Type II secretion system (T2SS), protein M
MRSDRIIVTALAILGLLAAFWFLILAPKRNEASDLQTQVTDLQAQTTEAEASAAASEQAKTDFSSNYKRLITLGKAVPTDADTPGLLTELQVLSDKAGVDFQSISLSNSGGGAAATVAPPATATTTTTAVPSEAAAALLPIGATVGPAGLPVMPYEMQFDGGFFQIADFFGLIDGMVYTNGKAVAADGRLLTIDGFNLTAGPKGFPDLTAALQTTSYLTPAAQGITAGATPTGPDPAAAAVPATTPPATDPAVSAAVVAN